jgi:RHS repeat-associated protein
VLAPFTAAAKEEMLSPWCADPALAADLFPDEMLIETRGQKDEKPHQGVFAESPLSHSVAWSNSTTTLGLQRVGREYRSGSRCTGKERDSESGLDMFGARYYGSSLGRFMTPDWAAKPTAVPYAMFGNPQSLNLYSYVNNNPTTTRDPDGHAEWYDTNGRHLGTDGVNDGGVVIQKASAVSYSSDHSLVDVAGSGFPVASFSRAEGNAIQSSVDRTLAPAGGDTKGGFHEEGFTVDASGIHNAAPGPAYQQGDATAHINQTINSTTTMEEHTHPVGTQDTAGSTTIGGTHFDPTPSPQDIHGAAGHDNITHVEASAGTSTVYVYNSSGVQAHVPLSVFPRPKKDDQ